MLIAGMILVNLPGNLTEGFSKEISTKIRSAGLACILLTGGLELDLQLFREYGGPVARLTALPGIVEAFTVMLVSVPLFGMPLGVSLTLGFIIAAVSPAIVV